MRPLVITAQARPTVEFKIVKWGHGAAIRLPSKVLGGLQASIGDTLQGDIQEGALRLRKVASGSSTDVVSLIQGLGLDPAKPEDLAKIAGILKKALGDDDSSHDSSTGGKP